MSARSRPAKPQHPPARTPWRTLRTAASDREGTPSVAGIFNWRVGELVIGAPRTDAPKGRPSLRDLLRRWLGRRAQPTELDAGPPFPESAEVETALSEVVKAAFDAGVQSERKRIAEVLQAPGVASYPLLAFELAIDGASVAQVSAVIARTEVAVQARIHPTESSPLESATPTLH